MYSTSILALLVQVLSHSHCRLGQVMCICSLGSQKWFVIYDGVSLSPLGNLKALEGTPCQVDPLSHCPVSVVCFLSHSANPGASSSVSDCIKHFGSGKFVYQTVIEVNCLSSWNPARMMVFTPFGTILSTVTWIEKNAFYSVSIYLRSIYPSGLLAWDSAVAHRRRQPNTFWMQK